MTLKALCIVFACCPLAAAQTEARPQFEVASVKPSLPPKTRMPVIPLVEGGPGTTDPTRISLHNLPVRDLIVRAYDVRSLQISGPAWMATSDFFSADDKFDIEARLAPGTTKDQFRLMLQNLLADRFGLKVHRETKESQVYALLPGKNAPKLKENTEGPQTAEANDSMKLGPRGEDGFPTMPPGYIGMFVNVRAGLTRVKFMRRSMPEFADWLWSQLKKRVLDRTGLTARYDFNLEYRTNLTTASSDTDSGGVDLFGAVQAQLNLKFVTEKGDVEMVVIDHVDRTPSGN